jgi:polygalacturonase
MTDIINEQRRTLLRGACAAGGLLAGGAASLAAEAPADPWLRAQQIAQRLSTPPVFRDEDFPITAFGARPCKLVPFATAHTHDHVATLTPAPKSHDCRPAIAAAIEACSAKGGGRVLIAAGSWYCAGPIVLRSNVNVHLAAGAQVYFSANPLDYARHGDIDCGSNGKLVLSRWQGNDVLNYSPMVYAFNQSNIALTGEDWTSVLYGQAGVPFEQGEGCWWDWAGKNRSASLAATARAVNPLNPASLEAVAPELSAAERELIQGGKADWRSDGQYLPALSEAGVPVARRIFGIGHYLRPCMVEFIGCTDVLLQGYQLSDSPFWQHHPINSRNVRISKVKMDSMGPNSDGFDPESCDTVLVDGCLFNTGDDCIAIKSGKNRDTGYGPTRNMLIQDCVMNSGHGGVTLGSEMAAGIEHVYAQRIEFRNINWATDPLGTAIRLKANMNRGGFLRHLYVRDVSIPNGVMTRPGFYKPLPASGIAQKAASTGGGAVITFDCDYAAGGESVNTRPPAISDVHISNLRVGNVKTADGEVSCYQAIAILGPVAASFRGRPGTPIPPVTNVSIVDSDFGTPVDAATPIFIHNVRGLSLKNVRIGGKTMTAELDA